MVTKLLGYRIDNFRFEEAVDIALGHITSGDFAQVVTINPEMFECAQKDREFANILNEADMVIPDGVGIKIGLKLLGEKAERIPGIDFAKRLLEKCAENNLPIAIIGAKEEIITSAIENLKKEISNLNIVYYHNGYFSNDNDIYSEVSEKEPALILVAMGSPRQEKFIYNAKTVLKKGLFIGIGGSLDVWSGSVKRAPEIFRKTGTEWLYRTITQPERFKRIFPTLPLFLLKVVRYKVRGEKYVNGN